MSLTVTSENFKIFDVSGITVEKKLAFTKEAGNLVPRNEDEAFIKEFIRERGGAKIGGKKIIHWGSAEEWREILWGIDDLHRRGWIKDDILKGREELPDIIEPDPEKDQVEGNNSYFKGYYSVDRYVDNTVYKEHDDAWEMQSMSNRTDNFSARVKKLDEFIAIYKDLSKMNGLWVQPVNGLEITMSCKAKLDDIRDDDRYSQSVQTVNVALNHSTAAHMKEGSLTLDSRAAVEYADANGDNQIYIFSDNCIWRVRNRYGVEIKDGKDEDGALMYKKVDMNEEIKVDIEMNSEGTYNTIEDEKLGWELKAAIFLVEITVNYHDYANNKSSMAIKQFIVKADVNAKKVIAGDNIRQKLEGKIPKLDGVMTSMVMNLHTVAWMGDIEWNMRIDDV